MASRVPMVERPGVAMRLALGALVLGALIPSQGCSKARTLGVNFSVEADAGIRRDGALVLVDAGPVACPPDTCPPEVTTPCGLVSQCGCPCDQACMLVAGGLRACRPPGPKALFEICADQAECGRGLTCTTYSDVFGICQPFCHTAADCGGMPCVPMIVPATGERVSPPVGACILVDCDVVEGTGCPPGMVCRAGYYADFDFTERPTKFCGPMSENTTGDPCETHIECEAGHLCANSGCAVLCVPGDDRCTGGMGCTRAPTPMLLDGVEYGFCQ